MGAAAAGYSSGNEGVSNPGIEIDPFTGIPYYDANKASKSAKSVGGAVH